MGNCCSLFQKHHDDGDTDMKSVPSKSNQQYSKFDDQQKPKRREKKAQDETSFMGKATRSLNLQFYKNEIESEPLGIKIEDMLKWRGDYNTLDSNKYYIQWLFPTQEKSHSNKYAQPIGFNEAEEMRATPAISMRFLKAYTMMLDLYGMELKSEETGEVQRCQKNYKERFRHLNGSTHNFHRITRIITALGIFGYEHFQAPLLIYMMQEKFTHKTLPDIPLDSIQLWIKSANSERDRNKATTTFTHALHSASQGAQDNSLGERKLNEILEGLEGGSADYDIELLPQLQQTANDSTQQRQNLQAQAVAPVENDDIGEVKDKGCNVKFEKLPSHIGVRTKW